MNFKNFCNQTCPYILKKKKRKSGPLINGQVRRFSRACELPVAPRKFFSYPLSMSACFKGIYYKNRSTSYPTLYYQVRVVGRYRSIARLVIYSLSITIHTNIRFSLLHVQTGTRTIIHDETHKMNGIAILSINFSQEGENLTADTS